VTCSRSAALMKLPAPMTARKVRASYVSMSQHSRIISTPSILSAKDIRLAKLIAYPRVNFIAAPDGEIDATDPAAIVLPKQRAGALHLAQHGGAASRQASSGLCREGEGAGKGAPPGRPAARS